MNETTIISSNGEKAVRTSGHILKYLGAVMAVFAAIAAFVTIPQIGDGGDSIFLQTFFSGIAVCAIGIMFWLYGSYIHKQNFTRDTKLYFYIALAIEILFLFAIFSLRMVFDFNIVIHLVALGCLIYGTSNLRKISIDADGRDPKRIMRFVIAGISIVLIYVLMSPVLARFF